MASKITFKVKLSDLVPPSKLDKLSQTTKKKISNELGEFLVDKILKDTSNQRSSVSGQKWKGLSKDYKDMKSKIAPGVANLELHGDMLDALKSKPKSDEVEIGVYGKLQTQKTDNHCHFRIYGEPTLPLRKFLPGENESLRPGIMREAVKIAKELVENAPVKRGVNED